jgi:hypothetical protein
MAKREQSPVAGHCSKVYLLWQTLIRHCVSLFASDIIDKDDRILDFRVYLKFFVCSHTEINSFMSLIYIFLFFSFFLVFFVLYIL